MNVGEYLRKIAEAQIRLFRELEEIKKLLKAQPDEDELLKLLDNTTSDPSLKSEEWNSEEYLTRPPVVNEEPKITGNGTSDTVTFGLPGEQ
jgi:hypothetical protein